MSNPIALQVEKQQSADVCLPPCSSFWREPARWWEGREIDRSCRAFVGNSCVRSIDAAAPLGPPPHHTSTPHYQWLPNDNKTDCVAYRGGREAGEVGHTNTNHFRLYQTAIWNLDAIQCGVQSLPTGVSPQSSQPP